MIELIKETRWEKIAVCFIYLCAQFLVLASLLLTTTSLAPHIVFIILAVVFYFITSIKDPGFYVGVVEPNQEDAELSVSKQEKAKQKMVKVGSQREYKLSNFKAEEWTKQERVEQQRQKQSDEQQEKYPSQNAHQVEKRTRSVKKSHSLPPPEKIDLPVVGKKSSLEQANKFNIFEVAKSMIGNIGNLVHKKDEQKSQCSKPDLLKLQDKLDEVHQKSQHSQGSKSDEKQVSKPVIKITQAEVLKNNVEQKATSSVKSNLFNSAIGKEDFVKSQVEEPAQFNKQMEFEMPQLNNINFLQINLMARKLAGIKRYCRMCQVYQPLRVKHCHSCDKCVTTFDHHCPWMGTCIGQKNKLFFLLFLIFQILQIFTIVVDLIRFLSVSETDNKGSVGLLLMVVILLFLVLALLLGTHLYLVARNLTTWQMLRWEKIEYLNIFDKKALSSPFGTGIINNFKTLWKITRSSEQKNWIQQINEEITKYRIRKQKPCKSQFRPVDTERRIFRSEKVVH